jgi:Na+/proline symporter
VEESKMKKNKVIAPKNKPHYLPIGFTFIFWLFFDRINAPRWAWIEGWIVVGIVWIIAFIAIWNQETVDIFEEKDKK